MPRSLALALVAFSLFAACLRAGEPGQGAGSVKRVFCGTLPPTWLVYSVSPDSLCAWNFAPSSAQLAFLPERFAKLPTIGGWNMHGLNLETLLALKPDLVIAAEGGRGFEENGPSLARAGIDVKKLKLETLEDYPEAFRTAGALCGAPARGEALAASFAKSLSELKSLGSAIPPEKRPSVYYACGPEGLETAGGVKLHTQALGYAGARNAFPELLSGKGGRFKVSLEQVLAANPDFIIARDRLFYESVFKDPRWSSLDAVKSRRVHLIPGAPLNWIDRPPSFMQLLGSWWLYSILHPKSEASDWRARAELFYREFLNVELDSKLWARIENPEDGDEMRK